MKTNRISILALVIVLAFSLGLCTSAQAEAVKPEGYPSGDIRWIVPAKAGAVLDISTRALLEGADLGGTVVIENIPGASNVIGTLEASQRPADGMTILTGNTSALILLPMMTEAGYDPADFRTIALLRPLGTYCVTVGPNSALDTAQDWIDLVKSGERFTYTVPNAGNATHLAITKALDAMGVTTGVYVPYNGTSEAQAAILNGEIDFAVLDTPDMMARAAVGDVKVLLVLNDKADPLAPNVPVIADFGVEGIDCFFGFQCVAVLKDTPDEVVEWIKSQINAQMATPEYQKYLTDSGCGIMQIMSEEELTGIITNARSVYAELLKDMNMVK